ncbi:MAG: DUF4157 domain-containing protein [Pseudomonadota bacterium]
MADHAQSERKAPALQDSAAAAHGAPLDHAPRVQALHRTARTLNPDAALVAQRALAAQLSAPAQRAPAPNRTGLPDGLKAGIESLSGMAMDDVRVHRNSSAPSQLQAHAYAQGTDIHLAPGQDHHLPHEAWHVVQQKQGRVKATLQMKGTAVNDDAGLEHEADVMGAKAMRAGPAQRVAKPARVVAAPAQRVAQLGKPKLNLRGKAGAVARTFSSVSFKNFKRPASNSSKQGQHGTAYVAFQDELSNTIVDKTPAEAIKALRKLVPRIRNLINPKTSKRYLFLSLTTVEALLDNAAKAIKAKDEKFALSEMEIAIGDLLTVRNQIPGTATVTTNTGGHGEGDSAGKLRAVETALRKKQAFPGAWGGDARVALDSALSMWRLLDINPIKNRSADVIAKKLVEHEEQMGGSYPLTYKWLGTKPAWLPAKRVANQSDGMPLKDFDSKKIRDIKKAMEEL